MKLLSLDVLFFFSFLSVMSEAGIKTTISRKFRGLVHAFHISLLCVIWYFEIFILRLPENEATLTYQEGLRP